MKNVLIVLLIFFYCCKKPDKNYPDAAVENLLKQSDNENEPKAKRLAYIFKAKQLIDSAIYNDSVKLNLYFRLANRYWNNGNLKEYKALGNVMIQQAKQAGDKMCLAKCHEYMGDYFYNPKISLRDSAFHHYLISKNIYQEAGNYNLCAGIDIKNAQILFREGSYFLAESLALNALRHYESVGNEDQEYICLGLLGIIYKEFEDYANALKYTAKSLEIVRGKSKEINLATATVLNNKGKIYLDIGNYAAADKCFSAALQLSDLPNQDPVLYALVLENIAFSRAQTNLHDEHILPLFNKAIAIKDSLRDGQVYIRLNCSNYFKSLGRNDESLAFANEALEISEKNGNPREKLACLKQLSQLAPQQGNYLKSFIGLNDSLTRSEKIAGNKFARVLYETDKIIRQKEQAEREKYIYSACLVIALLLMTLFLMLKIQRSKTKRLRLVEQQHALNEEFYHMMINQQRTIEEARQKEKHRIARDLHDGIMNRLASTRLNLFILTKKTDKETIGKCLPYISGIQLIEKEIRDISHGLCTDTFIDKVDFQMVIETLIVQQKGISQAEFKITMDNTILWDNVSTFQKMNIYRILQEAIQNIHHHSAAKNGFVFFLGGPGYLEISIQDDGDGFIFKDFKKGIGLSNIKSRTNEMAGEVDIISEVNKGTKILIRIPLNFQKPTI